MESIKKCCFTGYRPAKMPFRFDRAEVKYQEFENHLYESIAFLVNEGCTEFYTGMAMGFDMAAAHTVLFLKEGLHKPDIKLISVIPFENQSDTFTPAWKRKYDEILVKCDKRIIISKNYYKGCYQKRNEFMVRNTDCVMTWYDGQLGGTRNTLLYAANELRYIFNINPNYSEEFNNPQFKY